MMLKQLNSCVFKSDKKTGKNRKNGFEKWVKKTSFFRMGKKVENMGFHLVAFFEMEKTKKWVFIW